MGQWLNQDELEKVYRTRARGLRSITRKIGDNDAGDVAQDAYLRLIETSRKAPVDAPGNLLFRIARNLVIDRVRAGYRQRALYRDGDLPADVAADTPDQERALLAAERLRRALQIIDAMPLRRREVFLLHRLDNLSYSRIAAQLAISVKTVEKHMSAAMAQLSAGMREQ